MPGWTAIRSWCRASRQGKHLVNLENPWRKIRELALLPDLRLHDLRHSCASIGAGAGLGLPVIGALLGHAQAATTARYAHLASDPLQQAADLIGDKLAAASKG
jgi:integrase